MMKEALQHGKPIVAICAFAAAMFVAVRGDADITVSNQRLDRALYEKHDPKLVLAGRVTAFNENTEVVAGGGTRLTGRVKIDFVLTFHVDGVLFGDFKGDTLNLRVSSFEWPTVLVPQEAGASCILILDRRSDGQTWLCSVVPAKAGKFEAAKDYSTLRTVLSKQILGQLSQEKNPVRQFRLIEQVGPILEKDQAKEVEPFLQSKDVWVRRAALGAVTWATMDPKRITEMDREVATFFGGDLKELVPGFEPGVSFAPVPLFMKAYFPLECGWSAEEDARKAPLLPVFRRIADDMRADPWTRWQNGISPICRLGTTEDVAKLWSWYTTNDAPFRKVLLDQNPYNRQALLMGLSRILDLELPNWVQEQFLVKEKEQAETVRKLLVERKVIKE
jgi:hypothetical protein